MTSPEIVGLITAAVADFAESPEQAERRWKLQPARVVTAGLTSPTGIFDGDGVLGGDSTPVPLISLVGYCPAGVKVMVLVVPPAGNYVIAPLTPFETDARLAVDHQLNLSDTALQQVTGLSVVAEPGLTYQLSAMLFYRSSITADIKFAFDFDDSNTSVSWAPAGFLAGGINFESWFGATYRQPALTANAVAGVGLAVSNTVGVDIRGTVITGVVRDTLDLYAAQNTSDPTQSLVLADSWITLKRLSS